MLKGLSLFGLALLAMVDLSVGACHVKSAYNVTIPGLDLIGGYGNLYTTTKDNGTCLLITYVEDPSEQRGGFYGIDLSTGRIAFSYSGGYPTVATLLPNSNHLLTMSLQSFDEFQACSSVVMMQFNSTHAWTNWTATLCSKVYGQLWPAGDAILLNDYVVHVDETSSTGEPSAHLAAIHSHNGTTLWQGTLTITGYSNYQSIASADGGKAFVVTLASPNNQHEQIQNDTTNPQLLYVIANNGSPTLYRHIPYETVGRSTMFGWTNPSVYANISNSNLFYSVDIYSGNSVWSINNTFLGNTERFPGLYFTNQVWRKINETTIAFLNYGWSSRPDRIITRFALFDIPSGLVTTPVYEASSNLSCFSDMYTIDNEIIVVTGNEWVARSISHPDAVVSRGVLKNNLTLQCYNTDGDEYRVINTKTQDAVWLHEIYQKSRVVGIPAADKLF